MPVIIFPNASSYFNICQWSFAHVSGHLPQVTGHSPRVNDRSFFFLQDNTVLSTYYFLFTFLPKTGT